MSADQYFAVAVPVEHKLDGRRPHPSNQPQVDHMQGTPAHQSGAEVVDVEDATSIHMKHALIGLPLIYI